MKKIRELIRMHEEAQMSIRQISKVLNISRPVISQYISDIKSSGLTYQEIKTIPDDTLLGIISGDKKSKNHKCQQLSSKFDYFSKELKRTGVTLALLWEEYRKAESDCYSYSHFCYHYQVWKEASEISMHMEHKAGDKMFVDFTGKKLQITDRLTGKLTDAEVFVALLGASSLTYVEACTSQQTENWIKANENAFQYFGGVTSSIVPDCLKSAVRIVYSWIFARMRNEVFFSLEDLNKAIREHLEAYNNRLMQRPQQSRRELFNETEKQVLLPLPGSLYEIKYYKRLKVQFNYHVYLSEDKHSYSAPY